MSQTDTTGLKVDLVGDRLVISIDVDTLCHALEYGLNERMGTRGSIANRMVFVQELMEQLHQEEEDGTNAVHRMLDKAADDMVEDGAEGWEMEGDDE